MSHDADTSIAPKYCPFCRSKDVTATSLKRTASTYWRCEGCGQIWHPDRLRQVTETVGRRR